MRKLLGTLLIILLLLIGVAYVAYLNSNLILAKIISNKTLTPVSIDQINFYSKSFSIQDLLIGNPQEARLPTALRIHTISFDAPYKNYIEDPIIIEQITMNDLYVNIQLYTKDQTKGNWQTIITNMKIDHENILSKPRETLIKKLILNNIQIDLILADGKIYHLSPISRLEFDNVNSEKGVPTQEISEIIVRQMMHRIFLEKGIKSILEAPVNILKGVLPFL